MDGLANRPEYLDAPGEREPLLIAVLVNRLAFDILHDVVRRAVRGVSAIQNARDIGVVERGQHLSLLLESQDEFRVCLFPQEELERHILAERAVIADRLEDHAHAASAE